MGRKDLDFYRDQLFNENRLADRAVIFKNVTLPSLRALWQNKPSDLDLFVQIVTSESLPDFAKQALEESVVSLDFVRVFYFDEENTAFQKPLQEQVDQSGSDVILANVRLDDDDALSSDYLHQLSQYMDAKFAGFVVSLSKGYASLLDESGEITRLKHYRWLFSSAGQCVLSHVRGPEDIVSIYACGNHRKTDQKRPTIIDSRTETFVRSFHSSNDSGATFLNIGEIEVDSRKLHNVLSNFGIELTSPT